MVQKLLNLRQKILKFSNTIMSRKNFSLDNLKKTRLNAYVYDFSVDYDGIAVHDI